MSAPSFSRLRPQYVSLHLAHDDENSANKTINAEIYTSYPKPIVQDSSNWVCAVERFEISPNAIPFYDPQRTTTLIENITIAFTNITIKGTGNYSTVTPVSIPLNTPQYSLFKLILYLNDTCSLFSVTLNNGSDVNCLVTLNFNLHATGYIVMAISLETADDNTPIDDLSFKSNVTVTLPKYLNYILGFNPDDLSGTSKSSVKADNEFFVESAHPRIDLGDQFQHVQLTSSLNTISDIIGQSNLNVLTDFCPSTSYSNSINLGKGTGETIATEAFKEANISLNLRQKIIYIPNERRYLDLISPFGINFIRISAYYVDLSGVPVQIKLPYGGIFDVKLGFYKKE